MARYVVAAVGPDQPGIVAEVTRVFLDQDCNLEDSSMTVLRGQFAIMLVVDAPDHLSPRDLEADLAFATSVFGLVVSVWPVGEAAPTTTAGEPWKVFIHGADRRGIVHRIARLLADHDVNIVDLATRLSGDPGAPLYTMVLEVRVPPSVDTDRLRAELERAASELEVECRLHPVGADLL